MARTITAGETSDLMVMGYAVSKADGISGKTGETVTPKYSVAGATPANMGVLIEIDAANLPGWYYSAIPAAAVAVGNNKKMVVIGSETITANFAWEIIEVGRVWDNILTAATHNLATSAGRRIRTLPGPVAEGTAQGPGANGNQIVLEAGSSAVDGTYDPGLISIVGGTGEGQARLILEYDGGTLTATVDRTWKVAPDATSQYLILAVAGREHVNEGLLQAAGASTATLNALASSDDDAYNGQIIFLRSGAGEDQVRYVVAYDGTTKIATVNRAWDSAPDGTTGYVMLPNVATAMAVDGVRAITVTVQDQFAVNFPGYTINIYDATGTFAGSVVDTDADGVVVIYRNDGTYTLRIVGYQFDPTNTPETLVVTADAAVTYTGTRFVAPASVDPALCTVYGTLRKTEGGAVWAGERLSFYAVADGVVDANVQGNCIGEVITDAAGEFSLDLPRLASVLCVTTALGPVNTTFSVTAVIPDVAGATFDAVFRS